MKKTVIICCILFSTIVLMIIMFFNMEQNTNCYVVTDMGPLSVNKRIERGYRIIGRYKLYNPSPRKFNCEELERIKKLLPDWLKGNYPEESFDAQYFNSYSSLKLEGQLKYEFTMLETDTYIEIDFYRLKLAKKGKNMSIFIGKGLYVDFDREQGMEKMAYPFYTEEWEKERSDRKPFRPGDLW